MRRLGFQFRGGFRPLRYWPILLLATAIAESVHAPMLSRSNATPPRPDDNPPKATEPAKPPAKDPKKPGTWTADPTPDVDEFEQQMPSSLATPITLVPARQPDDFESVYPDLPQPSGPITDAVDPVLQPPSPGGNNPLVDGPGGGEGGGGGDNNGPGNGGHTPRHPTVNNNVAVPEPGTATILAVCVAGMLRRRSSRVQTHKSGGSKNNGAAAG